MMPFPGGIEALANGTLVLSLVLAIAYGMIVTHPPSLRRSVVKTASVALLALLAAAEGGAVLLVLGVALGAIGDAFLSRQGDRAFMGGLASFLLSHVAYAALFLIDGLGIGAITGDPARAGAAVAMTAAVIYLVMRLSPGVPAPLRLPVVAYAVAILAMGLAALTLGRPLVIAGAVLFIASDALLAIGRFLFAPGSPHVAWQAPTVWGLYYAAQICIVLGFVL